MDTDFRKLHEPGWLKSVEPSSPGYVTVTVVTTLGSEAKYCVGTEPLHLRGFGGPTQGELHPTGFGPQSVR